MKNTIKISILFLLFSCANIVPPTGGPKDNKSPNLISVDEVLKSNNRVFKFTFDENIQINNWDENFYISPPINYIDYNIKGNKLEIEIENNLFKNYIYSICLNSCIKDQNEGNILEELEYLIDNKKDTINLKKLESLQVILTNSYSGKNENNHWVLLYSNEIHDSLILKIEPSYIAKTNRNGIANFSRNIMPGSYKIASISGFDYKYNLNKTISFKENEINSSIDTIIKLYTFNELKIDSSDTNFDTIKNEISGNLVIKSKNLNNLIIELFKNDKLIIKELINDNLFNIKNLKIGEYKLRYFIDNNMNGVWDNGKLKGKIVPEIIKYYDETILIRENWDIEIEIIL
tara:strand:- start:21036 stop:22073 length:1038 start_codon:yes stop_codon:yes gene_type:complete